MAKGLLAGILIFAFILLAMISLQFVQSEEEGYTNTPPTRAADCQCLPGYIPSKKKANAKYGGGIYASGNDHYYYNPSETQDLYGIDEQNTCGIEGINRRNSMNYPFFVVLPFMPKNNWNLIMQQLTKSWRGMLSCDMIKHKSENTPYYFCQNLNDPSKTRKCY